MRICYIGGPTALLEVGQLRLLLDPTFDSPGEYPIGNRTLTKTMPPAIEVQDLGRIDAVLLSHDQHPDNLDKLGRTLLAQVPLTLSTEAAHERLGGNVRGLGNWEHYELSTPTRGTLRVTGVPAQHGPLGSEHLVGVVTGFVLSGEGVTSTYISGDNASLDVVHEIVKRQGNFEVAVVAGGGAKTALLGDAYLTLTGDGVAQVARITGARHVVPVHLEGWAHFTEGPDSLREAFSRSLLLDRLHLLKPGQSVEIGG